MGGGLDLEKTPETRSQRRRKQEEVLTWIRRVILPDLNSHGHGWTMPIRTFHPSVVGSSPSALTIWFWRYCAKCADFSARHIESFGIVPQENSGDGTRFAIETYMMWNNWLPASDVKFTDGPSFERYGKDFDPMIATGSIEVWIPVIGSRP
ncbi:MAG TPA: hypothetical protein VG815_12320 [Chloroflexota bacterium]|nr:hypothetical protein [Chloroflexota bacterium]